MNNNINNEIYKYKIIICNYISFIIIQNKIIIDLSLINNNMILKKKFFLLKCLFIIIILYIFIQT